MLFNRYLLAINGGIYDYTPNSNPRGTEGTDTLKTSNDKIVLENLKGKLDSGTSNSELVSQEVTGEVDGETSNGGISYSDEVLWGEIIAW